MDPITRASKVFLREAAAHWKARRGHVLFLLTDPSSRSDLVKTLRLAEQSPACRRPLFLFEEAFDEPKAYFAALAVSLAKDYDALKKGAAEEGVALAELPAQPKAGEDRASGSGLVGLRTREIGRALEGKLEGIDIALVPRQVAAPAAFRDAVTALAAELLTSGARLLVLATPGGPLSGEVEGRAAHFHVDPDELAEYLKNLGNSPSNGPPVPPPHRPVPGSASADGKEEPGRAGAPEVAASGELRRLLLSAAQASRKGDHGEARRLFGEAREQCAGQGWIVEEAVVLVALAGACLAAEAPDDAAASYEAAFTLATRKEAHSLAAQAALGKGAVRLQQKRYVEAMGAYAAAADAAERGQTSMLQVEARRMEGTAALAAGKQADALRAWKRAVETGSQMDAPEREASTWEDVVRALAALLRKNGMPAQADHVEAQAAASKVAFAAIGDRPPGEPDTVSQEDATWVTGPVDLSRLHLPILPFGEGEKG
jgi:tetratricopeptide (TPR) repeat protein